MSMFTVRDLFDDLAYGELSNLKIGNDTIGSIAEENYPKMISHINLGLIDLFQKFVLKKKEVNVHQIAGVTTYYLRTDHMDDIGYCGKNGIYIEKAAMDPFDDDIVKVIEIFDAAGDVIPLNDKRATDQRIAQGIEVTPGITHSAHDTLNMILPTTLEIVAVVYQAYYPKIVVKELFDPGKVKLYLPHYLRKPLMLYIAARIVSGMKVSLAEGEENPANARWAHYRISCKEIEKLNLTVDEDDGNDRFENSNLP